MKIIFLGTNGWYSTETGQTVCALIDAKEGYFVLDAGEGFQKLDRYIKDDRKPIYIFISHFHLDHIYGFHILDKFDFKQGISIIGKVGTKKVSETIINNPFTKKLEKLPYSVNVFDVEEGEHTWPVKFRCALLPHADPSMGYRLEIEGKTIVYCTDTGRSEKALNLAKGADVFISECALRPGEAPESDWPHLNPEEAAKEAKDADVKQLVLTHFDAALYTSAGIRKKAEISARKIFKDTLAAADDTELSL